MTIDYICSSDRERGTFVGRVQDPSIGGPCVVRLEGDRLADISSSYPTIGGLLENDDPVAAALAATPDRWFDLNAAIENSFSRPEGGVYFLAPCDLQALKACGVTFAKSMLERVIEERAKGTPEKAEHIRAEIAEAVGGALHQVKPGSPEAERAKRLLDEAGYWSQYLEVGIGPDAEVFTKGQVLSAVGLGAEIGVRGDSAWNNPEPEVVLAINSRGRAVGATLGNDVNLRDFEGRSALLLTKAKDNNGSCAIGPMIRLFDEHFGMDDVRRMTVDLDISGEEGFELHDRSRMSEISRDPEDLIAQTVGPNHQYPDGLMLFLGTLFAPTADRGEPGQGFTHAVGDTVRISSPRIGTLENVVRHCGDIAPWTFGARALFANLAARGLARL
ncbi:fumarylacetoacetate hydrolase family protein [Salinisphaera sp.]|uniref:fumarylacetoacetate hydrolase family protein n=1 Tax=Salinisphaera sp. TaxID=1914330 RepID=UPI002D77425C|nr:fumarylacetoacetate hydrolase family protein [Salinisphaera sp.]HET7313498.1 fumarylacetoacetate hydrolase family protein [Salinisphaera sp.]